MSKEQMVETLVADLMARARNSFEQDPGSARAMEFEVSEIRKAGAKATREEGGGQSESRRGTAEGQYTNEEVAAAIGRLKAGKNTLCCAAAALKSKVLVGRQVSAGLVNLARHMGITSSLWAMRKFTPRHKKGPRVVRSVACLRPVSICSDMAQLQDALWVGRNQGALQDYCGDDQLGGVSGPISMVLAVVILGELRRHHGMPTYLAFLDLKWGFDVAIHDGMLVNLYAAGVRGRDWLVMDDIVQQDRQTLELHGLLSETFILGCGTAQGRRFSVPLFNGLMRTLRDHLADAVPGGVAAAPRPWSRGRSAARRASRRCRPARSSGCPRPPCPRGSSWPASR